MLIYMGVLQITNSWKSSCQALVLNSISKKWRQTCRWQLTIFIVMWKALCVVSQKRITHSTNLYGLHYCELSRVVQHESYGLRGVHHGRHYCELSGVIQHESYRLWWVHHGRHYCELSRVIQHESYGCRAVHHGRHYCELSRVIQHESYGSEEWITEGITVNCQGWYSMSPVGSEECISTNYGPRSPPGWTYGFRAVTIEIAAGSEREERGIRGLHHGRLRIAYMASILAGGREALWRSNLHWHSTSPLGSELCQWRLLPILRGGERNKRIASRKAADCSYGQSLGWWKRSTVAEQSSLAQHKSSGLRAVPMEIAANSEREERGIRGLHHRRLWIAYMVSLLAGGQEIYCYGTIFVSTAQVLWAGSCANGDCCRFWEGGERNKRIASQKAADCLYGQSLGWWKRNTVAEQFLLAQHKSSGFRAVSMEITAGFWEGREMSKRIASQKAADCLCGQSLGWWKRNNDAEQFLLAQHKSSGLRAVPMEIAANSECEERGLRGLHHGRLRIAYMTSLLAGGREVLWRGNFWWHSTSPMGSELYRLRLLPVLRGRREE